jgi:hypothetical protein
MKASGLGVSAESPAKDDALLGHERGLTAKNMVL